MGDINFADLCDFHSIDRSQIREPSSGDKSLIENQMDLLTFLVNYTLMLRIILTQTEPGFQVRWSEN